MRIVVNRDRCRGLGVCETLAPDFFEIDDDGDLALLADGVEGGDDAVLAMVADAVSGCPTRALRLDA